MWELTLSQKDGNFEEQIVGPENGPYKAILYYTPPEGKDSWNLASDEEMESRWKHYVSTDSKRFNTIEEAKQFLKTGFSINRVKIVEIWEKQNVLKTKGDKTKDD